MRRFFPIALAGLALVGCSLIDVSSGIEPIPPGEQLPLDALVPDRSVGTRRVEFDRAEQLLQECMAAEGFEYYPAEIDSEIEIGALPPENLHEFASEHGYGLTEQLLPTATALEAIQAGVLPYYVEFDLSEFGIIETDPNVLYAMSLTPEEGAAYNIALDGPEFGDQLDPPDYGCTGRIDAQLEAELERSATTEPEWLDEADRRIGEQIESAVAEFAQADRAWAACMGEQGFTEFSARIDAPESIRVGILEIVFQATELTDQLDAAGLGLLHDREMSVAAADAGCYTTRYLPMSRGIEARIQTEVLTDLGVIANR